MNVLLYVRYDLFDVFCHACGEFVYFSFRVVSFVLLVDLVSVIEEKA